MLQKQSSVALEPGEAQSPFFSFFSYFSAISHVQKVELALPLEEIESELAKQRQIELGKTQGKDPLGSFEHKGKARDIVVSLSKNGNFSEITNPEVKTP